MLTDKPNEWVEGEVKDIFERMKPTPAYDGGLQNAAAQEHGAAVGESGGEREQDLQFVGEPGCLVVGETEADADEVSGDLTQNEPGRKLMELQLKV